MDIFEFDNVNREVRLNESTILLVREFRVLWDVERNKCEEDPSGELRLRAMREFCYIYLMLDWQSCYYSYDEVDRHEAAIGDAELTEEEFNDNDFRAACRKYREIQNSDRDVLLVLATRKKADDLIDYFLTIADLSLINDKGTPVYSAKDVVAVMNSVGKLIDTLDSLEDRIKRKLKEKSSIRGGKSDDYTPNLD